MRPINNWLGENARVEKGCVYLLAVNGGERVVEGLDDVVSVPRAGDDGTQSWGDETTMMSVRPLGERHVVNGEQTERTSYIQPGR